MSDCFGNFTHVGEDKDICAKCVVKRECMRKFEVDTVHKKIELARVIFSLGEEDLEL